MYVSLLNMKKADIKTFYAKKRNGKLCNVQRLMIDTTIL